MKQKVFAITVLAALLAFALCACGKQEAPSDSDAPAAEPVSEAQDTAPATPSDQGAATSPEPPAVEFATMQEAFDAPGDDPEMTYDEQRYIMAWHDDEWYYRVVADLPEGMKAELDAALMDSDRLTELLAPLPVTKTEVLYYPKEDEVFEHVGKTGADLSAEGFVFKVLTLNGKVTDCSASLGSFDYLITFEGRVDDPDTADIEGAVRDMKVVDASLQSLSWEALSAE